MTHQTVSTLRHRRVGALHVFLRRHAARTRVSALSGGRLPECFARIRAADLRDAQRQSARVRADAGGDGCTVFVNIEVLVESDVLGAPRHPDTVAMGSYHLDIREVQRAWQWVYEHPDPIGMVFTEGYLSVPAPAYEIPFRSLLPRRDDCTNLVVPVCISASHVAFSSVRMEPQYQMLGHAAGLAAAMTSARDAPAHDIDVAALQQRLADAGQVLRLG